MTDYDVIEYPHGPITQAHPDRIGVIGTLFGMRPAPLSRCRVLELGCGSGGNLIPLADLAPQSEFLGIDLSQTAIAQGRHRAEALGLRNLRLERMDVLDFPRNAGEFDYIIAHGLFSWVPPAVRERILAICREQLAPQGIAYVSYNAYPGCHLRALWREMMLFHSAQFEAPLDRIEQARGMLQLVAHGTGRDDAAHRLAQEEFARCREASDSAIFHDDLAPLWQPFYFHEFAALAAGHGLQFVGEATYSDMLPTGIDGAAEQALRQMAELDPVIHQQYLDFFKLRRFRRTLLCRDAVALRRPADVAALRGLHFSAPLEVVAGHTAYRNRVNDVTVTTAQPVARSLLERLAAAWPASMSFDELSAGIDDKDITVALLHGWYGASFITVHGMPAPAARTAGERPQAWRVARLEASLGAMMPSLHHTSVRIEDAAIRAFLQLADGTRTRAELAAACGGEATLEDRLQRMARSAILIG